jgi:hypothetical protein
VQTKKRKMKAGEALVGMKRRGSQLKDTGLAIDQHQIDVICRVTNLRRQNILHGGVGQNLGCSCKWGRPEVEDVDHG